MTETVERDELDSIERSIEIDASAERVWALIAEPGWYINTGTVVEHEIRQEDGYVVVIDPTYGEFPLRTVALEPPRYAAFRWFNLEGVDRSGSDATEATTLVEFWISERPGGVTLRVLETGFAALPVDAAKRRAALENNTEGWEVELDAAKAHLEAAAV
ncbi:SRPBCC domain-containing protein [Microterricola viridarii]|uniref:Uncharacterized conserved protein YndB, AHSA1/START domain n=1 Tax=Microterricola viridarii TaxID=412690 RepID=A0A1H1LK67_9MICO|nr:SRPBCC domain-containing protein [Microterricola viridarii]SDR74908.1 Uncharacterized conserved protein YndB, AHSA1/START domain [Microterricola viridarii]